jgi:hypothetical protein
MKHSALITLLIIASTSSIAQIEIKPNNNIVFGPLLSASPNHQYYHTYLDNSTPPQLQSNPQGPDHPHTYYFAGSAEISCAPAQH